MVVNGQPQYQLVLTEGINRHVFGEGLNPLEQEWLAEVINEHIGETCAAAASTAGGGVPARHACMGCSHPITSYFHCS